MKKVIFSALLSCFFFTSINAHATKNSDERQEARNIKQDTRTQGRIDKRDCFVKNDKSNSDCRQDKRENRRDGRSDARDARW